MTQQLGYEEALQYAKRGWHVVPILKGEKRPVMDAWQDEATTDEGIIERWWKNPRVQGVGIVTGPKSGLFVLDVDVDDGKWGDETLQDLEAKHGQLPETLEVITGSGGRHYYFRWPEGVDVRNSAGQLGPGLDIRGQGGQVIAPGSIHPKHQATYEWEGGITPDDIPVAHAPQWLLDLCQPKASIHREDQANNDRRIETGVAIHVFNAKADNFAVSKMLQKLGWVEEYVSREGYVYMRRPGKDKGMSATIGRVAPGVMYSFTDSAPGFNAEQPYDPIYVFAQAEHNGDIPAADQWLSEHGWGAKTFNIQRELDEYLAYIDSTNSEEALKETYELSEAFNLTFSPPTPSMLLRTDGVGLIYPGKIHVVVGPPETGKSWISLYAGMDGIIERDEKFLYMDFEGDIGDFVWRAKLLGLTEQNGRSSFYTSPAKINDAVIGSLVDRIVDNNIKLVVIDSVNRIMARCGLNYENGPDYIEFTDQVLGPLKETGVAILMIDHVVKSKEARGRWSTGSEQKLGQVDVSYHLEVLKQFAAGLTGVVGIRNAKDRPGGVKAHSYGASEMRRVALFTLGENEDGTKDILLDPWTEPMAPEMEDKSYRRAYPWPLMEAISDLIVDFGPMPEQELMWMVEASKDKKQWAMKLLLDGRYVEGKVNEESGQVLMHLERPYRGVRDSASPVYDEDADTPDQ